MPASELPLSAAPPISITCRICGNEMKLVSVAPSLWTTVYAYHCANGHRHEIVTADK
jgi:hypothetical protein